MCEIAEVASGRLFGLGIRGWYLVKKIRFDSCEFYYLCCVLIWSFGLV